MSIALGLSELLLSFLPFLPLLPYLPLLPCLLLLPLLLMEQACSLGE